MSDSLLVFLVCGLPLLTAVLLGLIALLNPKWYERAAGQPMLRGGGAKRPAGKGRTR